MNQFSTILRYRSEDRELLPPDEVSRRARISQAFLQLCLDCGCPRVEGRLSVAIFLDWLVDHYEETRALAGLSPLAEVEGVADEPLSKLRLANALITLLDFAESRATDPDEKRQLGNVRCLVNRAVDRP